jgi:hypothetical protein
LPPGTAFFGSRSASDWQKCAAPGWFFACVSTARSQWFTAVSSTRRPRRSAARSRPVDVPPAPQNRSAARIRFDFAIPRVPFFLARLVSRIPLAIRATAPTRGGKVRGQQLLPPPTGSPPAIRSGVPGGLPVGRFPHLSDAHLTALKLIRGEKDCVCLRSSGFVSDSGSSTCCCGPCHCGSVGLRRARAATCDREAAGVKVPRRSLFHRTFRAAAPRGSARDTRTLARPPRPRSRTNTPAAWRRGPSLPTAPRG